MKYVNAYSVTKEFSGDGSGAVYDEGTPLASVPMLGIMSEQIWQHNLEEAFAQKVEAPDELRVIVEDVPALPFSGTPLTAAKD